MYVQYTDPAGYPPLDHSATLLARAGWDVLFVGIEAYGARGLTLRPHERIRVAHIGGRSGGAAGPLKYGLFAARAAAHARAFEPDWIYASDALAAPVSLMLQRLTGARLLYHEHDVPADPGTRSHRWIAAARGRVLQHADIIVVPGEARRAALGAAAGRARVVWNVPLLDEAADAPLEPNETIRLVYAGSLSPDRLPVCFVDALAELPGNVGLDIIGYATVGAPDHLDRLLAAARARNVADRVTCHGVLPRPDLLRALDRCAIGIATINPDNPDASLRAMVGPSNKPFDYMARGLPFLVTDEPAWRGAFVAPGYAVACSPNDAASVIAAIASLLDPATRAAAGAAARARIRRDWNYDRLFAPVLDLLEA